MDSANFNGQSSLSALWICAGILLLFGALSTNLWTAATSTPGADMYQFWGIGKIQRYGDFQAGSPYLHATQYTKAIGLLANGLQDAQLIAAQRSREVVDLTGPPSLDD